MNKNRKRFETEAVHAGQAPDPATGAIMPPVYLTSTYVQSAPDKHKGFDYSRSAHPTRLALEENLAGLEGAAYGLAFASGMAAVSTLILSLNPGDKIVCGLDVYGGTYRVFDKVFRRFGLQFEFIDLTDLDAVREALTPGTRIVWIETPSNPLLQITDIKRVAEIAHAAGARVAVDNTFATPALQRPFELGAELVIHSTTKYLGGHSDVVGGAIILNDKKTYEELKFLQNSVGAVPGPLDCFLVLRGVKTLPIRMERHCASTAKVAAFLNDHSRIARVFFPGLKDHPGRALAKRQMKGFGGMVSFELKGGFDRALKFLKELKIIQLAESLGGVESIIGHPATMTHASIPQELREKSGLSDGLLRLSVGLEDVEDLIEDIDQAIRKSA